MDLDIERKNKEKLGRIHLLIFMEEFCSNIVVIKTFKLAFSMSF